MQSFKEECCCFAVKKNKNDKDSERKLKTYVKFKIAGSGAKCINGIPV